MRMSSVASDTEPPYCAGGGGHVSKAEERGFGRMGGRIGEGIENLEVIWDVVVLVARCTEETVAGASRLVGRRGTGVLRLFEGAPLRNVLVSCVGRHGFEMGKAEGHFFAKIRARELRR